MESRLEVLKLFNVIIRLSLWAVETQDRKGIWTVGCIQIPKERVMGFIFICQVSVS